MTKYFISPLEKPYVFGAFEKTRTPYVKKEFTVWICTLCSKIHDEKPTKCVCSEFSFMGESFSLADIVGEHMQFGIERKRGSDLIHALTDNRLYVQLQHMVEVFKGNVGLVFEGSFEKVAYDERVRTKILAAKLKKAGKFKAADRVRTSCESRIKQMLSIPATCLQYGIAFIQFNEHQRQEDNILTLIKMLRYFDYKCGTAPQIRQKKNELSSVLPPLIHKLCTDKGVSEKLALRIFKVVKTPEEFVRILRDDPEKILAVEGIGKGKLNNLIHGWLV